MEINQGEIKKKGGGGKMGEAQGGQLRNERQREERK